MPSLKINYLAIKNPTNCESQASFAARLADASLEIDLRPALRPHWN
jgi:hypothetical protein